MVAPAIALVIEGGAWAFNAWRAWRLAATATAAVGTAAAINQARQDAQAIAVPTTDVCTTCQPPCAFLACGAPGSTYRGGAHYCMTQPTGDGRDSHHMPARSISPLPAAMGPAIQMDPRDHYRTNSYGATPRANPILAGQQRMIASGNFMAAQAIDVTEILTKFPGKYDAAIAQMGAYTACLQENGLI